MPARRPATSSFLAARRLGRTEAFLRDHPESADRALFDRLLRAMVPPAPRAKPRFRRKPGRKRRTGKAG